MTSEMISVIVPVYKVEEYLDECIQSLVEQTYTNLEIILVDDGSPDRCPEMCDAWAQKDSRIRVIHKENGGLSDARNAALEIVKGEYLCFVDSDDFVSEDMCQVMLDALKANQADIVSTSFSIYKNGESVFQNNFQSGCFTAKEAVIEMLLNGCITPSVCGKLFPREFFADVRFPVHEIYEDIAVVPKLFSKCRRVYYYEKPLYAYRHNDGSITKSPYSKKHSDRRIRDEQVARDVRAVWPDLEQELRYGLGMGSLSSLLMLAKDKEKVKMFRSDYDYYMKNVKENFGLLFLHRPMSAAERVKLLLVRLGLYGPLWRLLHK